MRWLVRIGIFYLDLSVLRYLLTLNALQMRSSHHFLYARERDEPIDFLKVIGEFSEHLSEFLINIYHKDKFEMPEEMEAVVNRLNRKNRIQKV